MSYKTRCSYFEEYLWTTASEPVNNFCGIVDWRNRLSLISNRDHCQRLLPSQTSDTCSEFELSCWMKFDVNISWMSVCRGVFRTQPKIWDGVLCEIGNSFQLSYGNMFLYIFWIIRNYLHSLITLTSCGQKLS